MASRPAEHSSTLVLVFGSISFINSGLHSGNLIFHSRCLVNVWFRQFTVVQAIHSMTYMVLSSSVFGAYQCLLDMVDPCGCCCDWALSATKDLRSSVWYQLAMSNYLCVPFVPSCLLLFSCGFSVLSRPGIYFVLPSVFDPWVLLYILVCTWQFGV